MKLKVTPEEKKMLNEMLMDLVCKGKVQIENELQHKAALWLVNSGGAVITKKKNYGRIAEIKNVA